MAALNLDDLYSTSRGKRVALLLTRTPPLLFSSLSVNGISIPLRCQVSPTEGGSNAFVVVEVGGLVGYWAWKKYCYVPFYELRQKCLRLFAYHASEG